MKTPIEALQFELRIIKSFADDLQNRLDNPNCDSRKQCEYGLKQAKDFIAQYEAGIEVIKISSNVPVISSVCVSCDEEKVVHELCIDCITKLINENKQTDL